MRGARGAEAIGVLVLAHGGSEAWNAQVRTVVEQARLDEPTQVAFGMGMHADEVEALQQAVDTLEASGAARIVAVPLLVSSHSEVMRQYAYLLGLREDGPWMEHARPVRRRVPLAMTPALDDDAVVVEVVLERARVLSRTPAQEAVVLIAHGPVSEADNARWLEAMGRIAERVQQAGGFRVVIPLTMRDDAPKPVQEAATQAMRQVVREQARAGRVLVVPLLLATGGIEQKIPQRLEGLAYAYRPAALLPHPKVAQWIVARIQAAQTAGSLGRAPVL